MKKVCNVCLEEKNISEFPKNGKYPWRPQCRPCWSIVSGNRVKEKLLQKKPDQYVICSNDDCLNIWAYKIKHGTKYRIVRICPHCGEKPEVHE